MSVKIEYQKVSSVDVLSLPQVPDAPVVAAAPAPAGRSSAKAPPPARSGAAKVEAKEPRVAKERVPLRSQPKGAFFVSMAEIEVCPSGRIS